MLRILARSHGPLVKAEDSQHRGCGFESRHHILDGCKLLQLKNNKKIKVAKWGTPKKYKVFLRIGEKVNIGKLTIMYEKILLWLFKFSNLYVFIFF